MRFLLALGLFASVTPAPAAAADPRGLPAVPAEWKIELVAEAPAILFPTACVVARDGAVYLGQDPMDMPGPPTEPIDAVVRIKDGKVSRFAEGLWAVMGLEWKDGTLYVVHAPYLSAFRDTNGDGKADERVDLVTGLGPKLPGFNGINDHIASGIRLGMDGYLYIAVGDKGIPRGVGRDGRSIQLQGGGVIRIRPDGSGLEVVSTGERNPLSVALSAADDVFTFGNDDDSKQWPNSLTHHIVGGHYGYPYQFDNALRPNAAPGLVRPPKRYLPTMGGEIGGAGTQGICYNEDGLPARYRGNLFFCDWGLQTVFRFEIEKAGATFRVKSRESLVSKGNFDDFRPFSVAASPVDGSLYLVDWAFGSWLADGPKTGRLYRLSYVGPQRVEPVRRPTELVIASLDHPALSVRLEAQRGFEALGDKAVERLAKRLSTSGPTTGRLHAIWALSAIGGVEARAALQRSLRDPDASVRVQAVRAVGIRPQGFPSEVPRALWADMDPAVRREAAIAVGRIGNPDAGPALFACLGDADSFVAWSVRHAIRQLNAWDGGLGEALGDPRRRDDALALTDEVWSVRVVDALSAALETTEAAPTRARIMANLAGLYRRYPEWSGHWFGTNPLAGPFPRKTRDWSPEGMGRVRAALNRGLADSTPEVRREAVAGLRAIGGPAAASLRARLAVEPDDAIASALCEALGTVRDPLAAAPLAAVLQDGKRAIATRSAALTALASLAGRAAMNARLALVYDPETPAVLLALALPELGRSKVVPANDLAEFVDHPEPSVRAAALRALALGQPVPAAIGKRVAQRLDDPNRAVRTAAISSIAATNQRAAIPKLLAMVDTDLSEPAQLALAAMPDPRAIPVYIRALNQTDVTQRSAAVSALMAIRDLAASELEAKARARAFKPFAEVAVERILVRTKPILEWKVIGPFPRTTAQVFLGERSIDFARTHVGAEGRRIAWTARKAERATGRVLLDDFKRGVGDTGGFGYDINGSPDVCAFGYAEIVSDKDRMALMLLGSSGSLLVAVNEQPVHDQRDLAGRPYSPDSDRLRVRLNRGVNRILVQSRQGIGAWSFSIQVSDPAATLFATHPGRLSLGELRSYALSHAGDPRRGQAIFFDPQGVGCVKCHAAGGQGAANLGPDLTGLAGKYDKAEIVRSVLEPSNRIATGYQPLLLARTDGKVLTGLLRSETDTELELIDADANITRVAKVDIEERGVNNVSVMPAGIVDTLTAPQFADLIAYLQSLKGPATSSAVRSAASRPVR